jgi:hypothetical protein
MPLNLFERRMGFGNDGQDIVLPLDARHSVQEPVEFFGRERRAEARDSARDFATCGRDCFYFSAIIHQSPSQLVKSCRGAARIIPPRRR